MDHLIAETVAQAFDLDRVFAVELSDDIVARFFEHVVEYRVVLGHAQPSSVKNTAKKASSTMTMKIAWTTALVVRRPTCSESPWTCMPW